MHEGALSGVKAGDAVLPVLEAKKLRLRIREPERLLGRKTMEVEILKDSIRIALEKLISRFPVLEKNDIR
jgi:transposase